MAGTHSLHALAMPITGRFRSSVVKPMDFSVAR